MGQKSSHGEPDSRRGFHPTGRGHFSLGSHFPCWKSFCLVGYKTRLQSDPPGLDLPIPAVGECKIVQVILIVKKKVQQNRVLPRFHRNLISVAKNSWFSFFFPMVLNILREQKTVNNKQTTKKSLILSASKYRMISQCVPLQFGEADFSYSSCSSDVFCNGKMLGWHTTLGFVQQTATPLPIKLPLHFAQKKCVAWLHDWNNKGQSSQG